MSASATALADATALGGLRPRLRDDVVWLPRVDGVYIRGPQTAMVLRGASAYELMSAVSTHLTGEHTLDELCDGLAPAHAATVTHLVRTLIDRGLARNLRAEPAAVLPSEVAAAYADQLAFLGHFVDDPGARFAAFRAARVLLLGGGHVRQALAIGLMANGLRELTVTSALGSVVASALGPAVTSAIDSAEFNGSAEIHGSAADGGKVTVRPVADPLGFDLVIYATQDAGLDQVAWWTRACYAADIAFLPVVVGSAEAVMGPLSTPGSPGCWLCAQIRLTANRSAAVAADTWRSVTLGAGAWSPPAASEQACRMLGSAAALEAFRLLTGALEPDCAGALVVQDSHTLEARTASLIAHPCCPMCAIAPADDLGPDWPAEPTTLTPEDHKSDRSDGLRTPDDSKPGGPEAAQPTRDNSDGSSVEARYRRLSALVDSDVGVFARFTDDPLRQSPLPTARLRVGPPATLEPGDRHFVAFDLQTILVARLRALHVGLGYYADRLAAVPIRPSAPGKRIDPRSLHTWSGLVDPGVAAPAGWVRAACLSTGDIRWVPAAAVFPHSRWNEALAYERTPAGIGVGVTTAEVAEAGLRSALAYAALDALLRGRSRVTEPDLDGPIGTGEIAFLRDCLGHLGLRAMVRIVDDGGPVPTVLARAIAAPPAAVLLPASALVPVGAMSGAQSAEAQWLCGLASSRMAAIVDALTAVLGTAQLAVLQGEPADLGDPLVADLPTVIHPNNPDHPATDPNAIVGLTELIAAVVAQGNVALLVDTTPSDVAAVAGYRVGRVLIGRA